MHCVLVLVHFLELLQNNQDGLFIKIRGLSDCLIVQEVLIVKPSSTWLHNHSEGLMVDGGTKWVSAKERGDKEADPLCDDLLS